MILVVNTETKQNDFIVTEILNTGKNYIYTLRSEKITAKFKFDFKKWKFMQKTQLSDEELEKAYSLQLNSAVDLR